MPPWCLPDERRNYHEKMCKKKYAALALAQAPPELRDLPPGAHLAPSCFRTYIPLGRVLGPLTLAPGGRFRSPEAPQMRRVRMGRPKLWMVRQLIASVKRHPRTVLSTPGTSGYRLSYKRVLSEVLQKPPRSGILLAEVMPW